MCDPKVMCAEWERRLQNVFCCRDGNEAMRYNSKTVGSEGGLHFSHLFLWSDDMVSSQGLPPTGSSWNKY